MEAPASVAGRAAGIDTSAFPMGVTYEMGLPMTS
jgi:hypothetical protein